MQGRKVAKRRTLDGRSRAGRRSFGPGPHVAPVPECFAPSLLCGRPQASLAEIGNRGADQRETFPSRPSRYFQLAGH